MRSLPCRRTRSAAAHASSTASTSALRRCRRHVRRATRRPPPQSLACTTDPHQPLPRTPSSSLTEHAPPLGAPPAD
eukprot:1871889-Prymnesium_polylepis.1